MAHIAVFVVVFLRLQDRCHRIGQQAKVHCIYFVATGTLDEILWKLLEKKFRELGEFVEGKEKLKMIVHKTYKSEEELHVMFDTDDRSDDDDDEEVPNDEPEILPLDSELQHDIEELAREEQDMLRSAEADRDDDDGEPVVVQPATNNSTGQEEGDGKGRSQDDAIALSDSEDENEGPAEVVRAVNPANHKVFNSEGALPECQIYKLTTQERALGLEIAVFRDRVVVAGKTKEKTNRLGEDCKPDIGDVLVAVGAQVVPAVQRLEGILNYLQNVLQNPPSVLYFAEDPEFQEFYRSWQAEKAEMKKKRPRQVSQPGEVIELDD